MSASTTASTHQAQVWLVTGSSRGFGHELVTAALERGDTVVATARDKHVLAPTLTKYGADRTFRS